MYTGGAFFRPLPCPSHPSTPLRSHSRNFVENDSEGVTSLTHGDPIILRAMSIMLLVGTYENLTGERSQGLELYESDLLCVVSCRNAVKRLPLYILFFVLGTRPEW